MAPGSDGQRQLGRRGQLEPLGPHQVQGLGQEAFAAVLAGARRWLVVAAIVAAALLAGYMLWFRDSSFVAVERVDITGSNLSPRSKGISAKPRWA